MESPEFPRNLVFRNPGGIPGFVISGGVLGAFHLGGIIQENTSDFVFDLLNKKSLLKQFRILYEKREVKSVKDFAKRLKDLGYEENF